MRLFDNDASQKTNSQRLEIIERVFAGEKIARDRSLMLHEYCNYHYAVLGVQQVVPRMTILQEIDSLWRGLSIKERKHVEYTPSLSEEK